MPILSSDGFGSAMLESLDNKPLIFITGKGGVGENTCTGAIAQALTRRGRKVPQTLNEMMGNMGPFAKRARTIVDWIRDSIRSAIVAVCLPEEMPVNETIETLAP